MWARTQRAAMPYSLRVPPGRVPGELMPVEDPGGGGLRGYAQVPPDTKEGDEFELASEGGGVLDFDEPGFPLFERLARQRGAYNEDFCPEGFERSHWRHVRGRPCWLGCWVLTFAAGLVVAAWYAPPKRLLHTLAMYCLTFLASVAFVLSMWWEHRRELEPGVLVAVFWTSGTVGVCCAAMLNWSVLHVWPLIDPYCHPLHPLGFGWPEEPPSALCVAKASVEWILMAGLIEETVKFLALLRLRPSPEAAVDVGCCGARAGCCCHRRGGRPLGPRRLLLGYQLRAWWARLAPTPYAFAAAALASGGGLATIENFHYIFFDIETYDRAIESGDLSHALGRIVSSCAHIVWTGLAGITLAQWHFLPEGHPSRPRYRWSGLLVPIISHGLYDVCSVLRTCYPEEHCMEWPPDSRQWVCGQCVLPPGPRFVVGVFFQALFIGSGLLFHHRWTYTLLDLSVECCRPLLCGEEAGAAAAEAAVAGAMGSDAEGSSSTAAAS